MRYVHGLDCLDEMIIDNGMECMKLRFNGLDENLAVFDSLCWGVYGMVH